MSGSHWCTVFPEMKLCSLLISKIELLCSVSQFLHSYICERLIYFQDRSVFLAAAIYVGWSWENINCSQTHECGNWDTRIGIHKWDFCCSVVKNNAWDNSTTFSRKVTYNFHQDNPPAKSKYLPSTSFLRVKVILSAGHRQTVYACLLPLFWMQSCPFC